MLNELRKLLPEFTVTHRGSFYDIKRLTPKGRWLHIPAILNSASVPADIAKNIRQSWEAECSK